MIEASKRSTEVHNTLFVARIPIYLFVRQINDLENKVDMVCQSITRIEIELTKVIFISVQTSPDGANIIAVARPKRIRDAGIQAIVLIKQRCVISVLGMIQQCLQLLGDRLATETIAEHRTPKDQKARHRLGYS